MRNISFCDSETLISRMSFYLYLDWSCTIPWNSWNNCNVLTTRWHCEIAHIAEAPIGCWSLLGTRLSSSQLWSWQQATWQHCPSTTLQLHSFVIWHAGPVQRVPSSWFRKRPGAPFSADLVVSFCISYSMSIRPPQLASQLLSSGERGSKPKLQSLSATTWANLIVPPLILLVCSFSMF